MNFRQGDPRWKRDLVGHGRSTMSAVGCLVTALAEIAVRSGAEPSLTPGELNARARRKAHPPAFQGSGAVVPEVAKCAQLSAPADLRVGWPGKPIPSVAALRAALRGALAVDGGFGLVQVDHDDGDPEGDHWVAVFAEIDGEFWYSDPATGDEGSIDAGTMTGAAGWGNPDYSVTAVIPVRS